MKITNLCVSAIIVLCCGTLVAAEPDASVKVIGRVIDEQGNVQAGAIVRAIPDSGFFRAGDSRIVEGRTDEQGRYALQLPWAGETTLAVDAMKPGFRSSFGMYRALGRRQWRSKEVKPGATFEISFVLESALYVAGTVVNEAGRPVRGADALAYLTDGKGGWGHSHSTTDDQGRFEIFQLPLRSERGEKGRLVVEGASLLPTVVEDVYALPAAQRENQRIVLKTGTRISGRVSDALGKPAVEALVEARFDNEHSDRQATLTDADGRFALSGVPPGKATLFVQALAIKQHLKEPLAFDHDLMDLELRLEPLGLKEPADTIELWGMKLASITPEVRAAYALMPEARGVIVLAPGPNSARLKLGQIREGDYLVSVGTAYSQIKTVQQFVERMRALVAEKHEPPFRTDVAYSYNRPRTQGQDTLTIELTAADARQLDTAEAELAGRPAVDIGPRQGFLGVWVEDNADPGLVGVRVNGIREDTPAARAGLRISDVLEQVDGVNIQSQAQLVELIRGHKPGDKVTLKFRTRVDGRLVEVPVVLDEL